MTKVGIIIITFNQPELLVKQLELLRRFCKDEHDCIIIDNSTNPQAIIDIRYHARKCKHVIRAKAATIDASQSHSFAANLSVAKYADQYDYLFWLDHDAMPFKPFSVIEILGEKTLAGLAQAKHKTYFWPGCFMAKTSVVKDIDFSPSPGLDTGGNTYKLIKEQGLDNCEFFSEVHEENPFFNKTRYNFYSVINETFLHFIAGSNWSAQEHHQERLNSLFNVLQNKCETQ